eukprot:scaffold63959_cov27-Tisochrysis_lutea.AAC.4
MASPQASRDVRCCEDPASSCCEVERSTFRRRLAHNTAALLEVRPGLEVRGCLVNINGGGIHVHLIKEELVWVRVISEQVEAQAPFLLARTLHVDRNRLEEVIHPVRLDLNLNNYGDRRASFCDNGRVTACTPANTVRQSGGVPKQQALRRGGAEHEEDGADRAAAHRRRRRRLDEEIGREVVSEAFAPGPGHERSNQEGENRKKGMWSTEKGGEQIK